MKKNTSYGLLSILISLSPLYSQAKENIDYNKIIKESHLSVKDFENVGAYYKHITEHEKINYYQEEFRFATAAALLGSAEAMLWLGEMYQGGHAKANNSDEALKRAFDWWDKAFASGQPRGYTDIALVYMHQPVPGGGEEFGSTPLNYHKAVELLDKATDSGDMKAPRILGLMYQNGTEIIKSNPKMALNYFIKASERGDSTGTVYYADALLDGVNIKQDINKAISLYQKIIDNKGHDIALSAYKMGEIYKVDKYVKHNYDKAVEYYKISSENGMDIAKNEITKMEK
jgi:uncharacterized protein